jgi:hypothetical protein
MLLDKGKLRTFDESTPYFPCLTVRGDAQEICILEQAQWWTDSFKLNFEEKAKKLIYFVNNLFTMISAILALATQDCKL